MTTATPDELAEMTELRNQAHQWIDTLQVSGMGENTVVSAILVALVERAIRAGGTAAAARWLRSQADFIDPGQEAHN